MKSTLRLVSGFMKFDTHLHTRYSRDCTTDPFALVKHAKKIGLGGIFITDHNSVSAYSLLKGKVDSFHVFCAQEIDTDQGEVIGLFLNDLVSPADLGTVIDNVKSQDGFLLLPHPFDRLRKHLDPSTLSKEVLSKFHAIEVFNSRIVYFRDDTQKALDFASKNPNLIKSGGSDEHFIWELGSSFVKLPSLDSISPSETTAEEIRKLFFRGNLAAHGKPNSPLYHIGTKAVKFLKKRKFLL